MKNPFIEKYAKLLVEHSLYIQKNEKVRIRGNIVTEPLLKEIFIQALKKGAFPKVRTDFDDWGYALFKYASKEQIEFIHETDLLEAKYWDSSITIGGGRNLKSLSNVNPDLLVLSRKALKPISDITREKLEKKKYKWTYAYYPTFSSAQEANMSLDVYTDYLFKMCKLYADDPIKEWQELSNNQSLLVNRLDQAKEVRIKGLDTDLSFSVEGRNWVNCDGKHNMPDGEIFTTPVENSLNGRIRYTFPAIYSRVEVEDVVLEFKKGKVINAHAKKGEDFLRKTIQTDEGASRVGEFAIGTNMEANKFIKNMLFDEKMGGTIHIALGESFPETNGLNRSTIHWDMLKDMREGGEIFVDGTLLYKNGEFINS